MEITVKSKPKGGEADESQDASQSRKVTGD